MDKLHLPCSAPVFNVHFALLGTKHIVVPFRIDKPYQAVFLGETVGNALAMLPCSPRKIDCGFRYKACRSADLS